ncbi:hypothetical protein BDZ94DRAFT_1208718 [Collybia nuda]|uniref:SP-RING-type domain-containing protein n=1 Tax=Collybia nuda TaxID=64659 RepID=A0A9P6CNS3_9AGAR|nr:hypothetical protein BDZ94DRAFT_1208718 [Collybia nuda]
MPTAISSRRKHSSRRRNSSDIEEDRPSQPRNEEVDEQDGSDDQPRRRTNGVRKEKRPQQGGQARRKLEDYDGEMDKDEKDDDDKIDITNFQDQPIAKVDMKKLLGLAQDWNQMEKLVRQNWKIIGDAATSMAEAVEGDDGEEALEELDVVMKDLLDVSAQMKAHEQALDDIYQQVAQGVEITDAGKRYSTGAKSKMETYVTKTTRQKYAKVDEYRLFKEGIHEVQFPDKPLPPITDCIPKEDGDESDDDEELEMGGVTQNYLCPITLTLLQDPLTSDICGHSFSGDAIRSTFRGAHGGSVKCPASGCNKTFKLLDLKLNKDLAKKAKNWDRRNKRAAEDSGAEEVVE